MTATVDTDSDEYAAIGRTQYGKVQMAGGFDLFGRKYLERQSRSTDRPYWDRIGFYCHAHMERSGHTPLGRGVLADFLGITTKAAGDEVRKAIKRGVVAPGSTQACLIAPYEIMYEKGQERPCGHH